MGGGGILYFFCVSAFISHFFFSHPFFLFFFLLFFLCLSFSSPTILALFYTVDNSRVERKTMVTQTYFLKPLFRGNLDPFVNNANLGAIAHTSNGT